MDKKKKEGEGLKIPEIGELNKVFWWILQEF